MADKIFNSYMFAVENGFRNIFIAPDIRHEWTEEQITTMLQELDKIYMFMSYCYKNNIEPLGFSTIDKMFKSLVIHSKGPIETEIKRSFNRCGLGTTSGSIGYDGSIYGCQEQVSKDINNIFYIGNIESGINSQLHEKLIKEYIHKQKAFSSDTTYCNTCLLRNNCVGWTCPSTSWDLYQDFHKDSIVACRWREKIFANNFILYSHFNDNKIFNNYFERVNK